MTTSSYDSTGTPRVTLTREGGFYEATLEVTGLDPQRDLTAEERRVGITSLNPPTVRIREQKTEAKSHRRLIDACQRAVTASATSTLGSTGGPGGLLLTHFRVALAVRAAIRGLDEDI